jgi:hypothetical protein
VIGRRQGSARCCRTPAGGQADCGECRPCRSEWLVRCDTSAHQLMKRPRASGTHRPPRSLLSMTHVRGKRFSYATGVLRPASTCANQKVPLETPASTEVPGSGRINKSKHGAACPDRKASRIALASRYSWRRRTTCQNDDGRHGGHSAGRHVRCVRVWQAGSA